VEDRPWGRDHLILGYEKEGKLRQMVNNKTRSGRELKGGAEGEKKSATSYPGGGFKPIIEGEKIVCQGGGGFGPYQAEKKG